MIPMDVTKNLSIVHDISPVELVKKNANAHAQTVLDFVTTQQERVMGNVKSYLSSSSLNKDIGLSVLDETSHKLVEEKLVNDIKSCETLFASIQEKIIAPLGQLEEQKKKLNEVIKERQMIISSWKKELSEVETLYQRKYSKIDRFISLNPKFKMAELLKAARKYSLTNSKKPKRGKITKNEKDTTGPYGTYNEIQKSVLYRIHLVQLAYVLDCIYTCQKLEDLEAKKTEELHASFIKAQTEINTSRRRS